MAVQITVFVAWQPNKNFGENSDGIEENLNLLAKPKLEIDLI